MFYVSVRRFALEDVYLLDDYQALQSRWSSATSKKDKVRVAKEQIEMCATRNEVRAASRNRDGY